MVVRRSDGARDRAMRAARKAAAALDDRTRILHTNSHPWLPAVKTVLGWLPDVKAAEARDMLAAEHAKPSGRPEWSAVGEVFIPDKFGGKNRVSPAGARMLRDLYAAGAFPTGGKPREGDLAALDALCERDAEIEARIDGELEKERAKAERLPDLADVNLGAASFELLNALFFHHTDGKNGALDIGGIKVGKRAHPLFSNSGKSKDFRVTFFWTDPESGRNVSVERESKYAGNRSNDAARNWGLGRE